MAVMTVKKLIAALQKHNPNALVAFRDQDQGDDEINNYIRFVNEGSEELIEARAAEGEKHKHIVVLS